MADEDLVIKISAQADLQAIKQAEAEIDRLTAGVQAAKARIAAAALQPGYASAISGATVPAELLAAGGAFGVGGAGTTGLTAVAADLERAKVPAQELASASLLMGANLTRARSEAIILARELATGVPTTRTLSSLMGSLGIPLAAAAIGGYAVFKAITAAGDAQKKLADEAAKYSGQLVDLAHKWHGVAQAARSIEDIGKTAAETLGPIEEAQKHARDLATEEIGMFKKLIDSLVTIPGIVGKPFEAAHAAMQKVADEAESNIEKQGRRAIEEAEKAKKAWDDLSKMPLEQAIEKASASLQKLQAQQQGLKRDSATFVNDYVELDKKIKAATSDVEKLQKAQQQAGQKLSDAQDNASAQVKQVLVNEEAARESRAAGRDKDADMFEKSAKLFEKGMTPDEAAELAKIRGLQQQFAPPPPPGPKPIPQIPGYDFNTSTGEYVPKSKPGEAQTTKGAAVDNPQASAGKLDSILSELQKQTNLWS